MYEVQSGRYLETLGWVSANIPADIKKPLEFTRHYLDPSEEGLQVCVHIPKLGLATPSLMRRPPVVSLWHE